MCTPPHTPRRAIWYLLVLLEKVPKKRMGSEKTPALYEYGFTKYNTVTVLLQSEEIGKATFSKASEV